MSREQPNFLHEKSANTSLSDGNVPCKMATNDIKALLEFHTCVKSARLLVLSFNTVVLFENELYYVYTLEKY